MLLQGGPSVRHQDRDVPARIERDNVRTNRVVAPPATAPAQRTYPPITWSTPSLGQALVGGLGGIARTAVVLTLLGVVSIGSALTIAIVVARIVEALGFNPSSAY